MIRRVLSFGLALALAPLAAGAGWDRTKPSDSSLRVASEVRSNFQALENGTGGDQLVADNGLEVWVAGETSAPTFWAMNGTGAAIARTGTALGDTSRHYGRWAAKLTSGGAATAQLYQRLLSTASWDTGLRGLYVSCGGYVKSSTASTGRLYLYDGTTTTTGIYHSGDGTFQWLTVSAAVGAAVSGPLDVGLDVATGTKTAYLSALTCVLGQVPPRHPQLSKWADGQVVLEIAGTLTTGATKKRFRLPARAGLIEDVQAYVGTAPTGQAIILDLNTWDGANFTTMYSNRPTIAAAAARGNAAPDGTYARRCFIGLHASTVAAGEELTLDIDQVGSGTAGADLVVEVRYRYPLRPLRALLAVTE